MTSVTCSLQCPSRSPVRNAPRVRGNLENNYYEEEKKISSRVAAFLCWPYHLLRIQLREDGGDRRKKENRKGKKENVLDAFAFSVALLAGVSTLLRCRIRVREKPISTSILFFFSSMLIRCLLLRWRWDPTNRSEFSLTEHIASILNFLKRIMISSKSEYL